MAIVGRKAAKSLTSAERDLLVIRRQLMTAVDAARECVRSIDRILDQRDIAEVKALLDAEEAGDGEEFETLYLALTDVVSKIPLTEKDVQIKALKEARRKAKGNSP